MTTFSYVIYLRIIGPITGVIDVVIGILMLFYAAKFIEDNKNCIGIALFISGTIIAIIGIIAMMFYVIKYAELEQNTEFMRAGSP